MGGSDHPVHAVALCFSQSLSTAAAWNLTVLRCAGGPKTRILLSHVRRWKSDKIFFQQARKLWDVTDISECLDPMAKQTASHSRGALHLFELKQLGLGNQRMRSS